MPRRLTADEVQNRRMTERELLEAVKVFARVAGYVAYHEEDSRRQAAGMLDLMIIGDRADRRTRLIFAELKVECKTRGRLRPSQVAQINRLLDCGQEVYVWRPRHWRQGAIERVLNNVEARAGEDRGKCDFILAEK